MPHPCAQDAVPPWLIFGPVSFPLAYVGIVTVQCTDRSL
jgi:hypothetical protein